MLTIHKNTANPLPEATVRLLALCIEKSSSAYHNFSIVTNSSCDTNIIKTHSAVLIKTDGVKMFHLQTFCGQITEK